MHDFHLSEPRSNAESKVFLLVGILLEEWVRQVEGERTEGRVPRETGAGRYADARLIEDVVHARIDVVVRKIETGVEQSAEVAEHPSSDLVLLRQTHRKRKLGRPRKVLGAAKEIAGFQIARPDAPGF